MWKNRIETCLNNKNPSTTPIVKDESSIKRHFRVVRAKRKRGRPKKKQTKKEMTEKKNSKKSASPKNENKKPRIQSSMNLFFEQEKNEVSEDEEETKIENQTPTKIQVSNETNSG